jgi:hypothetical protein
MGQKNNLVICVKIGNIFLRWGVTRILSGSETVLGSCASADFSLTHARIAYHGVCDFIEAEDLTI